jgi:adenine phosphoribosyltransferase
MDLKKKIRNIPDFPEKGIVFRDISPLLEDKKAFAFMIREFVEKTKNLKIDKVVGIDARGFILAGILAEKLGAGMVMLRKKGKLPFKTESIEYDLEYGKEVLEIQKDSIKKGERVLLVDDVLATGGTMLAATKLVKELEGKVVAILFLIVLDYLPGRERLKDFRLLSLINYQK